MSTVVEEVDGCCPLAGLDDSVVVLSVDALGVVAVDIAGASVVAVAVGVVPVDTTTTVTTVDRTSGVLAVEELVVLVTIGGDAVRYNSVTSMYPGSVVTAVDVVGTLTVAAALVDDVTVALCLDRVVVDACSDASSEITTVSWKSISISGIIGVMMVVDVAACCCLAASSSAV